MTKDNLITLMLDHVNNLMYHKWPLDPKLAEIWRKQVAKTRGDVFNPSPSAGGTFVCANIFSLDEEILKTLKRIIPQFLGLSPITSKKSHLRKGKRTSYKKLVLQNACSGSTSKSVVMIVREVMKRWKPIRTTPF